MVFSHKSAVVEILVFFKKVQSRWRKWSKIEVEKTVLFYQVEKMGSPVDEVLHVFKTTFFPDFDKRNFHYSSRIT